MPTRIFIIEDHPDFAMALKCVFEAEDRFLVCGIADDIPMALSLIPNVGVDLVTIDINLPGGSGLEQIPALRALKPRVPFLVLSNEDPGTYARFARQAGAAGYLRKGATSQTIIDVADLLLRGGQHFPGMGSGP